jgi:hypothetical protein
MTALLLALALAWPSADVIRERGACWLDRALHAYYLVIPDICTAGLDCPHVWPCIRGGSHGR